MTVDGLEKTKETIASQSHLWFPGKKRSVAAIESNNKLSSSWSGSVRLLNSWFWGAWRCFHKIFQQGSPQMSQKKKKEVKRNGPVYNTCCMVTSAGRHSLQFTTYPLLHMSSLRLALFIQTPFLDDVQSVCGQGAMKRAILVIMLEKGANKFDSFYLHPV